MADTKISAETAAAALTGTEVMPGVQSAANVKISAAQMLAYVLGNILSVNPQIGITYTVLAADRGKLVTLSNAASIAVTLTQAGVVGFEAGYYATVSNIGVGAATITPTTSTINGAATLVLTSGMAVNLYSDGTNYRAIVVDAAGVPVNAQTGIAYTYLSGDRGKLVTHSNAAAIAGTLPQASGVFGSGWSMSVQNRGAGTLTITPTTSTIDGGTTLALTPGQGVLIASDGANYFTVRGAASGSGGGLTNFTEAVNTAAPNAATPVASLTATNAATNVDAVLSPKGFGAIAAKVADSSTPGGNKRGSNAVDWQITRLTSVAVASGANAAIGGGDNNKASGMSAAIGGGSSNSAAGVNSTVPGGFGNLANGDYSVCLGFYSNARGVLGSSAHASGVFGNIGDCQDQQFVFRATTTNATKTRITADGGAAIATNQVRLQGNYMSYVVKGTINAFEKATGSAKSWDFTAHIKINGAVGTTAMVAACTPSVIAADTGAAAWVVEVIADTTNGCLAISGTGEAAKTILWGCRVISSMQIDAT